MRAELQGLSAETIRAAAEASLRRLERTASICTTRTATTRRHRSTETPARLRRSRASGEGPLPRIVELHGGAPRRGARRVAARRARPLRRAPAELQPRPSPGLRGPARRSLRSRGLACVPYFALAKGFFTGKYRLGGEEVESQRAEGARRLPRRTRVARSGRARRDRGRAPTRWPPSRWRGCLRTAHRRRADRQRADAGAARRAPACRRPHPHRRRDRPPRGRITGCRSAAGRAAEDREAARAVGCTGLLGRIPRGLMTEALSSSRVRAGSPPLGS